MPDPQAKPLTAKPVTEEDLLANAIPIELEEDEPDAIEVEAADRTAEAQRKIMRFEKPRQHREWARQPNVTGAGAVHCKTFIAKFREESLIHLDDQINEWLDAHPEVEVKFVTQTVGRLIGKTTEDALIVNLWV